MTWKSRAYDQNRKRKPSTPAQDAARDRSWRIFRLRSLVEQARLLSGDRRERIIAVIDEALTELGAATTAEHYAAVEARWKTQDETPADFSEVEQEQELPF